jgi:hypothetical protein
MLPSDLAPIYGPKAAVATGMGRETLTELRGFFASKLAELDRIKGGCADCAHVSGRVCRKFNATVPDGYEGNDCGEWQFDGVPW